MGAGAARRMGVTSPATFWDFRGEHVSWVVFAFSGPVLWAISVHLDKYLVERFFKQSDVAVLLIFTAFAGVVLLPFIWLFGPPVTGTSAGNIALILCSGVL